MDDEQLLAGLRRISSQIDPVPEIVMESARAAFLTRRIDEEFAELLLDSAVETDQVRGEEMLVRLLSFHLDDTALEVQVKYEEEQVSLRGLVDGVSGEVDIETRGERRRVPVDADGGFTARLERGAVRFRLRANNGRLVMTSWVLL